jgi:hypothetical protein
VTHPHVKSNSLCSGEAKLPPGKALEESCLADAFCIIRRGESPIRKLGRHLMVWQKWLILAREADGHRLGRAFLFSCLLPTHGVKELPYSQFGRRTAGRRTAAGRGTRALQEPGFEPHRRGVATGPGQGYLAFTDTSVLRQSVGWASELGHVRIRALPTRAGYTLAGATGARLQCEQLVTWPNDSACTAVGQLATVIERLGRRSDKTA